MTEKTLHNTDINRAHDNVFDLEIFGEVDKWRLLCKASSEGEGWMKSTKAMDCYAGCLVQVTTQQRNPDGSYAIAEALSFVPGVSIYSSKKDGRIWRWLGPDRDRTVE